jgi:hypothetical protein
MNRPLAHVIIEYLAIYIIALGFMPPLQRREELSPKALTGVDVISSQIAARQGAPTQTALQCDKEKQRRIAVI